MKKINEITPELLDCVIRDAWEDTITFEDMKETYGLSYDEIRHIMSTLMAPKMFKRWQTRISKIGNKHFNKFIEVRK